MTAWWISDTFVSFGTTFGTRAGTGNRLTAATVGIGVLALAVGCWHLAKQRWMKDLTEGKVAGQRSSEPVASSTKTTTMDKSGRHSDSNNNNDTSSNGKSCSNKHLSDLRREEKNDDSQMQNRPQKHCRNRQGRGLKSSRQSRKSTNSNPGIKKNNSVPNSPHKPTPSINGKGHSLVCAKVMKAGKCCLGQPDCLNTIVNKGRKGRKDGKDNICHRDKVENSSSVLIRCSDESEDEKLVTDVDSYSANDLQNEHSYLIVSGNDVCENEAVELVTENVVNASENASCCISKNNGSKEDLDNNCCTNNKETGSGENDGIVMVVDNDNDAQVEEEEDDDDDDEGAGDDDIDFPSLYGITFQNRVEEEEEDGDDDADDDDAIDDDEMTNNDHGNVDGSSVHLIGTRSSATVITNPMQMLSFKESDPSVIFSGARASLATPGIPDSFAYPMYLRPDILDLLNERAKHSPPSQDPWCVRSPVFQSRLRTFVGESLLDASVCELGACIFVNVMTNGLTEPPPSFLYEEGHHLSANHANSALSYNSITSAGASISCNNRPKSAHPALFTDNARSTGATLTYKGSNNSNSNSSTSPGWSAFTNRPTSRPGAFSDSVPTGGSHTPQMVFTPQQKLRSSTRVERPQSGPARSITKQVSPIDELTELFSRSSVRTAPGGMTMAPNPGNPQAGTLGALNQNVLYAASGMNNVASLTHGSRASTPSFGHSPYPLGTASANGAANGIKTTHHQHQPPQQQQQQQQQNQYPFLRNSPAEANSILSSSAGNRLGAHLDVLAFPTPSPNGSNQYSSNAQQSSFSGSPQQLGGFSWQLGGPYSHQQQLQQQSQQQHNKPYSFRTNLSPYARDGIYKTYQAGDTACNTTIYDPVTLCIVKFQSKVRESNCHTISSINLIRKNFIL
ncbi:atrophin-1-like [Varroa jacobsoni]|uniref:atrophin-1-like n=1 Tax=Varroa jacobsoni TaxID=62625 RepID=UPI000BF5A98D|nr:atrophin-1-like [Varroa jacobsoni]